MELYKPVGLGCTWTVKEKHKGPISHKDYMVPVLTQKNTFTINGLTALASALSGNYTPPVYLALASNYATVSFAVAIGAGAITLSTSVDQSGDTQIVLGLGLANQEVVTFSSAVVNLDLTTTYNLTTVTVYAHAVGDQCTRQPNPNDAMSNLLGEQQYDPLASPTLRANSLSGYSGGSGNWIIQYYFVASTAAIYISDMGLTDSQVIGAGTLHNHVVLGLDHTAQITDIEIDGSLTLINM